MVANESKESITGFFQEESIVQGESYVTQALASLSSDLKSINPVQ